MYQHVLLPTDGSRNAERAIDHAFAIAGQFGATLHVLSVLEEADHRDQIRADQESEIEDAIAGIRERADREGVPVVDEVRSGVPQDQILEYVEDNAIDMIAMGTHGQSGLGRVLTGSVAEGVIRDSPVPVVVVRPTDEL